MSIRPPVSPQSTRGGVLPAATSPGSTKLPPSALALVGFRGPGTENVIAALAFWAGATLVLSRHRWFARRSLADRLRPYEPGGLATAAGGAVIMANGSVDGVLDAVFSGAEVGTLFLPHRLRVGSMSELPAAEREVRDVAVLVHRRDVLAHPG